MPTVNTADLDWETLDYHGAAWRRKRLAQAAGGEALGCSLYELPAGERSWPYHYHAANEEALYVLEGAGTLRLAGDSVPLEAGDYVAFPADERGAHRVVNDGTEPLQYLMISTMDEPEVTVYPDSEKIGVFVGGAPGDPRPKPVHGYYRLDDDVDYWDGEDGD